MGGWRFSIGRMLFAVAIVAWCLVVSREPSELWSSIAFGVTLAMLCAAPMLAWSHRGRSRYAWAAFASAGWARFVITMLPKGPDVTAPAPWKPMTWVIRELLPPKVDTSLGHAWFRHQCGALDILLVGLIAAGIVAVACRSEESVPSSS